MLIELIRHGETDLNRAGRYQGSLDVPLSAEGRKNLRQAEAAPERVYVSPLLRARQTAAVLFPEAVQIPIEGLREMCFGEFEGRNFKEMEHDAAYRAWVDGMCMGKCPGGESRQEFCERTCRAFMEVLEREQERTARRERQAPAPSSLRKPAEPVVIVAHGGTQMAVLQRFAAGHQCMQAGAGKARQAGQADPSGAGTEAGLCADPPAAPEDDYYTWQLPLGHGYLLKTEKTEDGLILHTVGIRDYTGMHSRILLPDHDR